MTPQTYKKLLWSFAALALVAALLAAVLLSAPYLVRSPVFKELATALVSHRIGGQLDYAELRLKLGPHPSLHLGQPYLSLSNGGEVRAERLTLAIRVLPLLRGQLQLSELILESPRAKLPLARSGSASSGPSGDEAKAWSTKRVSQLIEQLQNAAGKAAMRIQGGRLDLLDGEKIVASWREIALTYAADPHVIKLTAAATSTAYGHLSADLLIEPISQDLDGHITVSALSLPKLMAQLRPHLPITISEGTLGLEVDLNAQQLTDFDLRLSAAVPALNLRRKQQTLKLEELSLEAGIRRLSDELKLELTSLKTAQPPLSIAGRARRPEGAAWEVELTARPMDMEPLRALAQEWAGDLTAVDTLCDILHSGQIRSLTARSSANVLTSLLKGPTALKQSVVAAQVEGVSVRIPKTDLEVADLSGRIELNRGVLAAQVDSARLIGTRLAEGRFRMDLTAPSLPLEAHIGIKTDLAKLPQILPSVLDKAAQRAVAAEIDTLSGKAGGRFEIAGAVTDLRWGVQVDGLEAHLTSPRLPMPVAIESASGRYADATLTISNLSGWVGHSSLNGVSGSLEFGKRPMLKNGTGRLNLALDECFDWLKAFEAARQALLPIRTLDGRLLISDLIFTGPLTDPLAGDYRLKGRLQGVRATSDHLPGPLTLSAGGFQVSSERVGVTGLEAALSDTALTATGTLSHPFSDKRSLALSTGGIIGPRTADWALAKLGGTDWIAIEHPMAVSRLSVVSDLSRRHSIDAVLQPVDGPALTVKLQVAPDKIAVPALTITDAYSDARLAFEKQAGQFTARFKGRLDLRSLEPLITARVPQSGWVAGDWRASQIGSDWHDLRMTGRLEGGDLLLGWPEKGADAPLLENFALTATGSQLVVHSAALKWDEMGLDLNGWLGRGQTGLHVDLQAEAPFIDGDKILAHFEKREAATPQTVGPSPAVQTDLQGVLAGSLRLHVDHLKYGAHHIRPLAAKISINEDQILVEIPQADLCDISLAGSLKKAPDQIQLQLQPTSASRNVGQALACLFQKPIEADGRLYLVGDIFAKGPFADLVNKLNGPVFLTATEGRIYKANLLSKILALVNVTEIFAGQYPGFGEEGLAYKLFAFDGRFKNGVFAIDTCSLDSPTLQMTCKGRIDLPDDKIDITVLAAPLRTVDRIVKHLPAIGYVLGGTLISIPIRVHGPLGDPSVVPLSPSAVGEGVLEMMKRTFRLPVILFTPQSADP
jgi:uncharacterized protein YhdP